MASGFRAEESAEWKALQHHVNEVNATHLRDLLKDEGRNGPLCAQHGGILLDYSRQRFLPKTFGLLQDLAKACDVPKKIEAMTSGVKINTAEDRAVLHVALRASRDQIIKVDGKNVVPEVYSVLDRIKVFSDKVRSGEWKGASGKKLTSVVSIGIGGSYLGGEFVAEALKTSPPAAEASKGRILRFLANVDPVAVTRALKDLDPETTLVVVISKTFTTAETMLNARTLRNWLQSCPKIGTGGISKHVIAVSANPQAAKEFGIETDNVFGFWDWVGGRYSVSSAVGVVPLSLQFGFDIVKQFLEGAHDMDEHFVKQRNEPAKNLPIIMGLIGVWNSTFFGHSTRAILPYSEALLRFAAHLQQLDMESNGKRVALDGHELPFESGEITFGEPGTNGQHSFYQLVHQGRVIPADFIGFVRSQTPISMDGEIVSNHDELMSNFFAQPDALAYGKTIDELKAEGVPEELLKHKEFPGNRPSTSLLLDELNAFKVGQLLALYEHRTAVQGFIWGINSFDQWGVELGKVLGKKVRNQLHASRTESKEIDPSFNSSTTALIQRYLQG